MTKSILIGLATVFFLLAPLSAKNVAGDDAHPPSNFSLGILPPVLEINAKRPANVRANITIQNLSENQQNLSIAVKPFRLSDRKDGTVRYLSEGEIQEPDVMILKKVSILDKDIPAESITLNPLESRTLVLALDLDSKTPIGDYYFSIIFFSGDNLPLTTSLSQASGGIATNVILSVGKKGTVSGQIKEFSVPAIVIGGPIPITLLLFNNSDHYVIPTGIITVRDMFGRDAGMINVLPQYILAKSSRYMIDSDQASENYKLSKEIEQLKLDHPVLIWPKRFLFGLYTVNAHIKLSDEGPIFETKTKFIAVPAYAIFAISFISFVIISIYLRVKRKI